MEHSTPSRRALSLRSSKKKSDEKTPKNKLETKVEESLSTPQRNNRTRSNGSKYDSPSPMLNSKEKLLLRSKTPKTRVNLIKSLLKSTISPTCSSQAEQYCEVEWDCDSPGFTKADLKKNHKKDTECDTQSTAPQPHRTLFTRLQTVSNKTEEKNSPIMSDELDKLLRTNSFDKKSAIADGISPSSSNGFVGFGSNSKKVTGSGKSNSPQCTDDFDDLFSDSLLEETQAMENIIYNNGLQLKSKLESGCTKNIVNLITSPKQAVVSKKLSTIEESSKPCSQDKTSKRIFNSTENRSSKRFTSSMYLSAKKLDESVTERESKFRTHRSSFSLKPKSTYEDNRNLAINKKNISGCVIGTKVQSVPSKSIQNNNSIMKNNRSVINNTSMSLTRKSTASINKEKLPTKNCGNGQSIRSDVIKPVTCNTGSLAAKSKTVADFNPDFNLRSSPKPTDNFDVVKNNKMAAMQTVSDDDDSMVDYAAVNLEEIEKQNLTKTNTLKSTESKPCEDALMDDPDEDIFGSDVLEMLEQVETIPIDDALLDDDYVDLFGPQILEMVTQVENSAMIQKNPSPVLKSNNSTLPSLSSKAVPKVASFKQSTAPNVTQRKIARVSPSCQLTRRSTQTLQNSLPQALHHSAHALKTTINSTKDFNKTIQSTQTFNPNINSTQAFNPTIHSTQAFKPTIHSTQALKPTVHSTPALQLAGSSMKALQPVKVPAGALQGARNIHQSGHALKTTINSTQALNPTFHSTQTLNPTLHSTQAFNASLQSTQIFKPNINSPQGFNPTIHSTQAFKPIIHSTPVLQLAENSMKAQQPVKVTAGAFQLARKSTVYSKEEIALNREAAIKRRANRAKNKPS